MVVGIEAELSRAVRAEAVLHAFTCVTLEPAGCTADALRTLAPHVVVAADGPHAVGAAAACAVAGVPVIALGAPAGVAATSDAVLLAPGAGAAELLAAAERLGAFGLFRCDYLLAINGYLTGNITEDMDLVVRLQRYVRENKLPDTMPFVPDPVAWTEVPASRAVLGRQRERWHRGLIGTMWTHRDLMFNPKYGAMGMISFPFYVLGEMLAPVVELFGYLGLLLGLPFGLVSWSYAGAFLAAALGYGFLLSLWAIVLEEMSSRRYQRTGDILRLVWYAAVESFGYRQLTVWFRLQAFSKYMRGVESWGHMKREGFAVRKTPLAVPAVKPAG